AAQPVYITTINVSPALWHTPSGRPPRDLINEHLTSVRIEPGGPCTAPDPDTFAFNKDWRCTLNTTLAPGASYRVIVQGSPKAPTPPATRGTAETSAWVTTHSHFFDGGAGWVNFAVDSVATAIDPAGPPASGGGDPPGGGADPPPASGGTDPSGTLAGGASPPADTQPGATRPAVLPLAVAKLAAPTKTRLTAALTGGVPVTITTARPATVTVQLLLTAPQAKAFGVKATKPVVIGTAVIRTKAAKKTTAKVKVTRAWAKRLTRQRAALKVRQTITVRAPASRPRTITRTITLRR
ncbi:MAG TPA: hypothetical protein PKE32_09050, partial [Miltoncostaeaceae bacterium]|nr:hypothetical protein [Miltoncostaeaceae bacterium]